MPASSFRAQSDAWLEGAEAEREGRQSQQARGQQARGQQDGKQYAVCESSWRHAAQDGTSVRDAHWTKGQVNGSNRAVSHAV
jgi:hypothetical protein